MPPPPKAKLHKSTGRLKNINSSSSANSSSRSANVNSTNSSNVPSTAPNTALENRNNAIESPAIEQFELELYWCIQTLENSLNSGKLNPKQAQDAEKTLRSLKNGSQPMVKKRQLMQSAFGDYRKKMADEEKKLRVGNTSIQFVESTSKDAKASANKSHFVKKSFATTFGDSDFRFNFAIDDMQKLSIDQSPHPATNGVHGLDGTAVVSPSDDGADDDGKANAENSIQNENDGGDANKLDGASTIEPSNPFIKSKFHISDNSFKFNFSIGCD